MTTDLLVEGKSVTLEVRRRVPDLDLRVRRGDEIHDVSVMEVDDGEPTTLVVDGQAIDAYRLVRPEGVYVHLNGRTFFVPRPDARGAAARGADRYEIHAEMPGTVVAVHVEAGAAVTEGDPLVTLESMKLQVTVHADRTGTIALVLVTPNATFERGAKLLTWTKETKS